MGDATILQEVPKGPEGVPKDEVVWHPLTMEEHPIDEVPRVKAIVVGAGIAGINAAILLPAKVPGLDLVIYERDSAIVSVWVFCVVLGLITDYVLPGRSMEPMHLSWRKM